MSRWTQKRSKEGRPLLLPNRLGFDLPGCYSSLMPCVQPTALSLMVSCHLAPLWGLVRAWSTDHAHPRDIDKLGGAIAMPSTTLEFSNRRDGLSSTGVPLSETAQSVQIG